MTIYTIANTKGGVGKSTTAVHLATHLAQKKKTLLIDGDLQASSAVWAAWRRDVEKDSSKSKSLKSQLSKSPTTVRLRGKAILTEGKELSLDYDHTIIDVGGRDGVDIRHALILTDIVIIPVGASGLDAAALDDLLPLIETAKTFNDSLKAYYVFNKIDTRTKDIREMAEYLEKEGCARDGINIEILKSIIHERVVFKRAITNGVTVEETGTDKNAITEMKKFYDEVAKL